jgi:hypothetical protein
MDMTESEETRQQQHRKSVQEAGNLNYICRLQCATGRHLVVELDLFQDFCFRMAIVYCMDEEISGIAIELWMHFLGGKTL